VVRTLATSIAVGVLLLAHSASALQAGTSSPATGNGLLQAGSCRRVVVAATDACEATALATRAACHEVELEGGQCDAAAVAAHLEAARAAALDAITSACPAASGRRLGRLLAARLDRRCGVAQFIDPRAVTNTPTPTSTPLPPVTPTRPPFVAALAIGDVVVTAPTEGQEIGVEGVTFTWTAVSGATAYDLRVINAVTQVVIFTGSLSGNQSTTTLIGIPNSGNYTFRVRACMGAISDATCGNFATRNFTVNLLAPSGAPSITFPAAGATLTTSRHNLSWTAVSPNPLLPTMFYEVLLTNRTTLQTELQFRTIHPTTQADVILRSAPYRMQVRACQAGCGPYSPAVDFTVTLGAVPSTAPTITDAMVSGGNSLDVTWTAVAGAEWYQVQVVQPRPAGPGGGALTVASRQVTATTVTLPLPAGQASVIVAACNGDGCGPYSSASVVQPTQNPAAPQIGSPLGDSVVNGPFVLFAWSRIPGDTGGTLYRLFVQDLSQQRAALDVYTTQNFYGALLKAEGGRYAVVVIANPGLGTEVSGPPVNFTVRGSSAVAPTLMMPTQASVVPAGNVLVGWTTVPDATLYEYLLSVQGQVAASGRGVTPGTFVQVPLTAVNGLPTVYSGIVRACPAGQICMAGSDAGWGPWSSVAGSGAVAFTVVPSSTAVGGGSLHFNGNGTGDIDRVKIKLDAPARPIDVGGDMTLEFWMKTAAGAGNGSGACVAGGDNWINGNIIVDRDVFMTGGDHGDYGISLFGTGGRLAFGVAVGASGNTICGITNVVDSQWHHVAVTRSSLGAMRIYVDGHLDASGSGPAGDMSYHDGRSTSFPNSDPFLVIGAEKHDAGAGFPSYHGWIDEVRISDAILYTAPFTAPTSPLTPDVYTVALYHFDEGNGNTVFDTSGVAGGPSNGVRRFGGSPAGPLWSADTPFTSTPPTIALDTLTTALSSPTSITHAGDQRLFITQQGGAIRIWDGAQLLATPFLTISPVGTGGEQGLLSVAFHPNYAQNGFFYVYYVNDAGNVVIARYHVSANPNIADPASAAILLTIPHPASNHNGGQLQFGPDGYLYAGVGDGGGGCDDAGSGCNSQRDNLMLGKMLRLDVNQNVNVSPFHGVPPTNPFVGPGDPLDLIWAKGLRNPWRFAFDRLTGSLFIGDVGQSSREEVDVQSADSTGGQNYGWKRMEGFACNTCDLTNCPVAPPACNSPLLTLPVLDYDHGLGCAITGGYVYRGTEIPFLYGKYLFGDLCSGRLWWARDNEGTWSFTQFTPTAGNLWTFGQDLAGELYLGLGDGSLVRLRTGP
jgi:glucose/arabinose dehydrogenase